MKRNNEKGERVTLSKETVNGLANFAKPFETPDECLQRMLNCGCINEEMTRQKELEKEKTKIQ